VGSFEFVTMRFVAAAGGLLCSGDEEVATGLLRR
jgi:hypothetical protein